ncbi:MAG: hypothetical protein FJZ64_02820 [Chlamydiae bacterium]|nr:hypothetical protein [Chlamydiota bacterium]
MFNTIVFSTFLFGAVDPQIKVLKEGAGEKVLSYNAPLIRLKEEGRDPIERVVVLDELTPALKLGILGMQKGEIRKIYISSEPGCENPPIFEVEVIYVDATAAAHLASERDNFFLQ